MKEELADESTKKRLAELREGLFSLHKALIAWERVGYEEAFGAIGAPSNFLKLLLNDPWFAWLRPLSGLMAAVDEAMDGKEPLTGRRAQELLKQAKDLLRWCGRFRSKCFRDGTGRPRSEGFCGGRP